MMKKYSYILFVLVIFSCNDDDIENRNEFLNNMLSRYTLKEIFSENAMDLNFDGISHTDMLQEMNAFTPLMAYNGEIKLIQISGTTSLRVNIPSAYIDSDIPPLAQTFTVFSLFYTIDVNSIDGAITVTERDADFEQQYGRLISAEWADDILYVSFDMDFFTADGWITEKLHMKYKKKATDSPE